MKIINLVKLVKISFWITTLSVIIIILIGIISIFIPFNIIIGIVFYISSIITLTFLIIFAISITIFDIKTNIRKK